MNPSRSNHSRQAGFSMVELLAAAFIMAIGVLGLIMLQTIVLSQHTASRSRTTAVLIAEGLLDDAQNRGRAARLWSQQGTTPPSDLVSCFANVTPYQFNYEGRRLPDATNNAAYFNVAVTPTVVTAPVGQIGGLVDLVVTVSWTEPGGPKGTPRQLQVTLNRRINHATA